MLIEFMKIYSYRYYLKGKLTSSNLRSILNVDNDAFINNSITNILIMLFTDTNKGPSEVSIDVCQNNSFTMNSASTELDQFFNSTLSAAAAAASSHPDVTLTAVKKVEDSDDGEHSSLFANPREWTTNWIFYINLFPWAIIFGLFQFSSFHHRMLEDKIGRPIFLNPKWTKKEVCLNILMRTIWKGRLVSICYYFRVRISTNNCFQPIR